MKKNLSFFLSFFLILFSACQKEHSSLKGTFKEQTFKPTDETSAKTSALEFLATTDHNSSATVRNEFSNKEVNEGRWILEASGNYVFNINIPTHQDTEVKNYSLSINNIYEENQLKMLGSDMSQSFNELFEKVLTEETNTNSKAIMTDISIQSVTNDKTDLTATVVYGKEKQSSILNEYISWGAAKNIIRTTVNDSLDREAAIISTGCYEWIPETEIYYNLSLSRPHCYNGTCLKDSLVPSYNHYYPVPNHVVNSYDINSLESDIENTFIIGRQIVADINTQNSGDPTFNGTYSLRRMNLYTGTLYPLPEYIVDSIGLWHMSNGIYTVTAVAYRYCY